MRSNLFTLAEWQGYLVSAGAASSTLATYVHYARRILAGIASQVPEPPSTEPGVWREATPARALRAFDAVPPVQRGACAGAWRSYARWVKLAHGVDLPDPIPPRQPGRPRKHSEVTYEATAPAVPPEVTAAVNQIAEGTRRGRRVVLAWTWRAVSGMDRDSAKAKIADPTRPGFCWIVPREPLDVLHDWAAGQGKWLGMGDADPGTFPRLDQPLAPMQPQGMTPIPAAHFRKAT